MARRARHRRPSSPCLIIGGVGTPRHRARSRALRVLRAYPLPPGVFYTATLPVKIYPEYFVLVVAVSLVICLLATLYPARQAARLVPVEAIRYD